MTSTTETNITLKQDLLSTAQEKEDFLKLLSRLSVKELKHALEFLWDFLLDESTTCPTVVSQTDLLQAIEPLSKYQQRVKCQEPLGYCTVSMCVRVNPDCAQQRLTSNLNSLLPMVKTLIKEKPECLSYQFEESETETEEIQITENQSSEIKSPETEIDEPIADIANNELTEVSEAPPGEPIEEIEFQETTQPQVTNEIENTELQAKYSQFKDLLWSMVEFEGLDHVFLQTKEGQVLQFASTSRNDYLIIASKISAEIESVIDQGHAANYQQLLTVTKEYSQGVLAIRFLKDDIYLVGVSETVLPAKIHSLIVKLGDLVKPEL